MRKWGWVLGAVVVAVGMLYGLDRLTQRNFNQMYDRVGERVAEDQAVRAVCKDAAAKTLGVPVLNWDDSWPASPYTRVETTSTGYRARVAGDTGGTIHVFTCYIGGDKKVVQQVVKEQPAG
jgi:hypothetical protein